MLAATDSRGCGATVRDRPFVRSWSVLPGPEGRGHGRSWSWSSFVVVVVRVLVYHERETLESQAYTFTVEHSRRAPRGAVWWWSCPRPRDMLQPTGDGEPDERLVSLLTKWGTSIMCEENDTNTKLLHMDPDEAPRQQEALRGLRRQLDAADRCAKAEQYKGLANAQFTKGASRVAPSSATSRASGCCEPTMATHRAHACSPTISLSSRRSWRRSARPDSR